MKLVLKSGFFQFVLVLMIAGFQQPKLAVKLKTLKFYNDVGENYALYRFEYDKSGRLAGIFMFSDFSNAGMPEKPEVSHKFIHSKSAVEMRLYEGDRLIRISEHKLNKEGYPLSIKTLSPKKDSIYETEEFKYDMAGNLIELIYTGSSRCQFQYKDGNKITYVNTSLKTGNKEKTSYEYYTDKNDLAGLSSNKFLYDNFLIFFENPAVKRNTNLIKSITGPSGEKTEFVYTINMAGYVTRMDMSIIYPGQEEARRYSVKMEY